MLEITETRQRVLFIKDLLKKGYKDKHICMVSGANQSYVSKIKLNYIHNDTILEENETLEYTNQQKRRLNTLHRILGLHDMMTNDREQDLIYMHVLRFFMVEKEKIYNLYFHLSKSAFNRAWVKKDVDILKFNSELIGVKLEDYLDLIIDFFIE